MSLKTRSLSRVKRSQKNSSRSKTLRERNVLPQRDGCVQRHGWGNVVRGLQAVHATLDHMFEDGLLSSQQQEACGYGPPEAKRASSTKGGKGYTSVAFDEYVERVVEGLTQESSPFEMAVTLFCRQFQTLLANGPDRRALKARQNLERSLRKLE